MLANDTTEAIADNVDNVDVAMQGLAHEKIVPESDDT